MCFVEIGFKFNIQLRYDGVDDLSTSNLIHIPKYDKKDLIIKICTEDDVINDHYLVINSGNFPKTIGRILTSGVFIYAGRLIKHRSIVSDIKVFLKFDNEYEATKFKLKYM